uniref:Putative gtpase-activating protein n=1 Tax=Ixodes ricinus TaxID=34613 RepID=A0A131XYA5_IXORI
MAPTSSKLSLAAQFDDYCRQSVQKSNIEAEFLAFVKNQEECRKRWHATELDNARLRTELEALKGAHLELERRLAYTREVLEKEVQRRERSEEEKEAKLKQIELIREFIMNDVELRDETMEKLPFLRPSNAQQASGLNRLNTIDESVGSVLSVSRESLDDNDDGGVRRSARLRGKGSSGKGQLEDGGNGRKRRSQGTQEGDEVDPKRANVVATTTVTMTDGNEFVTTSRFFAPPASSVPSAPPLPRSATPAAVTPPTLTRAGTPATPATPATTPVGQQRCFGGPESTPRRTNSAGKLQSRVHDFVSKTVIKSEACGPCGKRIRFYKTALKCVRCRSTCHPECRDQVPLPCVQVSQTPTQGGTHTWKGTVVADHVPPTAPMVPAVVVHCIQEVERRGLSEVGLYRVSGSEREVREIREQFLRGKGVPNLSKADIHAICGVLKDFLRSLRETLICKSVWREFVKAAEMDPGNRVWATWQAVTQLPPPNRDTLAALVLHLQLVSETPETKMPISNLARVFGPTVVGYSMPDIDLVPNVHLETEKQARVMESILNIPSEYWKTYMDVESDDDIRTPELKPGPGSVILGPVHGSLGKKSGRTPMRHSTGTRRNYFTSPALK